MVFVGFGFLMTFLRRYSFGAVALNMVASAVVFLEAVLFVGASQQVFWNQDATHIEIGIKLLIDCSFCAASGMIAFGAVIGKTSPTQLLWLVIAQVPLYAVNQHLVIYTFKALDMGGSIVIHLFGAYYGLAASLMISRNQPGKGEEHPKSTGSYLNDIFSMVGTLFLWLYWPSFNGALASFLCVVNTVFSLMGSTIATFAMSALVHQGKMNMIHVQNSTLAGGVAIGAACTLRMTPGGSVVVGAAAGAISVLGFTYLTPFLNRKIGLGDTCGVHNLHGMPAILAGLVAGLAALGQDSDFLNYSTGKMQLGYQVLAMVVTMGIAIGGGLVVGLVLSTCNPSSAPELMQHELFDDGAWWNSPGALSNLVHRPLTTANTLPPLFRIPAMRALPDDLYPLEPLSHTFMTYDNSHHFSSICSRNRFLDPVVRMLHDPLEPLSHAFMTYDNSKHSNRSHHRAGDSSRHSNRSHQGAHGVGDTAFSITIKPNQAKTGANRPRWNRRPTWIVPKQPWIASGCWKDRTTHRK
eukprot:gene24559-10170_t